MTLTIPLWLIVGYLLIGGAVVVWSLAGESPASTLIHALSCAGGGSGHDFRHSSCWWYAIGG